MFTSSLTPDAAAPSMPNQLAMAAMSYDPILDRIARLPEVSKISGRSKTQIYGDPDFPQPVKLGASARASGWHVREVVGWMHAQLARRSAA